MAKPGLIERAARTVENTALWLAPSWAERRARSRLQAVALSRAYEAAEPTRLRDRARDWGSGNRAVDSSALQIRNEARHLDRNHDLVVGALDTLVQNIVGAHGITVEPMPRNAAGDVDESLVDAIAPLWRDYCRRPSVTWERDFAGDQRMAALSWLRDGEVFVQDIMGPRPLLDHGTLVPYSYELLEADFVPLDYDDKAQRTLQGIQRNAWGRIVGYWVLLEHPGEPDVMMPRRKWVDASTMRHLKLVRRLGQLRGVSIMSSVLARLSDIKDYEESERVAAKIAACMAAAIIKGEPGAYGPDVASDPGSPSARALRFQPGMIFDDLRPGEDVKTIDTSRPNTNLVDYRNGQLRMAAAGMRVSYSSMAKAYDGTYSAQRQELVEQWGAYGLMQAEFTTQFVRPVYENFIRSAVMAGRLRLPAGVSIEAASDASFSGPRMPWIDPVKEATAWEKLEENAYASGPEIIRARGGNPRDVLDQQSAWLQRKRDWGIPSRARVSELLIDETDDDDINPTETPTMANTSRAPRVLNKIMASLPNQFPAGPSTLSVKALANGQAEVLVYGPIGDSWFEDSVNARKVVAALAEINASQINVRVNSEGGSVVDGVAIYNALRRHSARVVVTVDGLAASIASLIAMAGDEVIMPANSLMMVHAPWTFAGGNSAQLREVADALDTHAQAMVTSYAAKTGKPEEDILDLLTDGKDHYYTARQAVEFGFADRIEEDARESTDSTAAAAALCGYIAAIGRAPEPIAAALRSRIAAAARPDVLARIPAAVRAAAVTHTGGPTMSFANPAPADGGSNLDPQAATLAAQAALKDRNLRICDVAKQFAGRADVSAIEREALADPSVTFEAFSKRVFDALAANCPGPLNPQPSSSSVGSASAGRDERDHRIEAQSKALMARNNVIKGEAREQALQGNPFANARLSALAEQSLRRAGVDTSMMDRDKIAVLALQSPGDFPILLENVLNKTVIAGYRAAAFTWNRFCGTTNLNDYRPHRLYTFGSFGDLQEPAGAHGEYANGSIADGRGESISGRRRGRILSVTPELIVNDDVGAIVNAATALGIAASRTVEKAVIDLFALNSGAGPTMSDGNPLFHTSHGNIAGTAAAPSVVSFDAARVLLLGQRTPGPDGDFIDASPSIWLGPVAVAGAARTVNNSTYDPDTNNKLQRANIAFNMVSDIVETPRLSGTRWYVFANPDLFPVIQVGFLNGRSEPTVTEETAFRSSALEWKVELPFGVGAAGWLGVVTNPGA